jgi:serine/threonine protein kinase
MHIFSQTSFFSQTYAFSFFLKKTPWFWCVSHPYPSGVSNVVRYHASWVEDEVLHIQMELCSGTLLSKCGKGERVSEDTALEVLEQIAAALEVRCVLHIPHIHVIHAACRAAALRFIKFWNRWQHLWRFHFVLYMPHMHVIHGISCQLAEQQLRRFMYFFLIWRNLIHSQGVHASGMAHMDVKADNIYLGLDESYRLGDFGLAASEDMLRRGTDLFLVWVFVCVCVLCAWEHLA